MNRNDDIFVENANEEAASVAVETVEKKNGKREKGLFIPATVLTVIATVLAFFYVSTVSANIELALRIQVEQGWDGLAFIILLPLLIIALVLMGVAAIIGICLSIPVVKLAIGGLRKFAILYLVLDCLYVVGGLVSFFITIGIVSA